MEHTLHDWQPESDDARTVTVEPTPEAVDIIEAEAGGDGYQRSVRVELQDGNLRVHAYDGQNDEPVSVTIHRDHVTVDQ